MARLFSSVLVAVQGPVSIFAAGFPGSVAVEIVTMDQLFRRSVRLPEHYRHWPFRLIRIFLACLGGLLAVAYNVENPIAAFQIGLSTPAIIKSLGATGKITAKADMVKKPDDSK